MVMDNSRPDEVGWMKIKKCEDAVDEGRRTGSYSNWRLGADEDSTGSALDDRRRSRSCYKRRVKGDKDSAGSAVDEGRRTGSYSDCRLEGDEDSTGGDEGSTWSSDSDWRSEEDEESTGSAVKKRRCSRSYSKWRSEGDEESTGSAVGEGRRTRSYSKRRLDRVKDSTGSAVDDSTLFIDFGRLVELYEKYNEVPPDICEKFSNLFIDITWELPLAHSLKNSFRRVKHGELNKTMYESGNELSLGLFTNTEVRLIVKNWESFKKEYEFDDPKFFFPGFVDKSSFRNEEKRKFAQYLAQGLPSRTLRSVFNKFYELYNDVKTGRFTNDEDKTILAVYRSESSYFKDVSKLRLLETVLRRKKTPISRRLTKLLQNEQVNENTQNIVWDLNTCENLICNLMDCKRVNDVESLRGIVISEKEWKSIGDDLGLCPVQSKIFWISQLSVRLFSKYPVSRNDLRSVLILWFHVHREVERWSDVRWADVSRTLLVPPFFLFKTFRSMVTLYVPPVFWPNLKDCVGYLYEHYIKLFSSKKLKDYRLQRLKFTNDRTLVKINDEDDELDEEAMSYL